MPKRSVIIEADEPPVIEWSKCGNDEVPYFQLLTGPGRCRIELHPVRGVLSSGAKFLVSVFVPVPIMYRAPLEAKTLEAAKREAVKVATVECQRIGAAVEALKATGWL